MFAWVTTAADRQYRRSKAAVSKRDDLLADFDKGGDDLASDIRIQVEEASKQELKETFDLTLSLSWVGIFRNRELFDKDTNDFDNGISQGIRLPQRMRYYRGEAENETDLAVQMLLQGNDLLESQSWGDFRQSNEKF